MRWVRAIPLIGLAALLGGCALIQRDENSESVSVRGRLMESAALERGEGSTPKSTARTSTTTTTTTVAIPGPAVPLDPAAIANPIVDPQEFAAANPVDFQDPFEPDLMLPSNFPNAPEFCQSGVRVAELGDELLELPPAMDQAQVVSQVRTFVNMVGRAVSLAPPEVAGPANQVRWIVVGEADILNSIKTANGYRSVISRVVTTNPRLEAAINDMVRFCGSDKKISLSLES